MGGFMEVFAFAAGAPPPLQKKVKDLVLGKPRRSGTFPTEEDESVREAARRTRLAASQASRSGTLLTSGAGLSEDVLLGRRTLLGQ